MKDSERKAWTDFVREREQTPKGKKRERRSEETPEPAAEDALDNLLREAAAKQGAPHRGGERITFFDEVVVPGPQGD